MGHRVGASGGGDFDPAKLDAPVPRPRQVFAIGLNYRAHAAEGSFSAPDEPTVFPKWPACIVGQRHDVVIPVDTTDYEVELVAAIARPTWKVPADSALSHVAGFTIGQDLSDRTLQRKGPSPQWGWRSVRRVRPTDLAVTARRFDDPRPNSPSRPPGTQAQKPAVAMIFEVTFIILPSESSMYRETDLHSPPAGVGYARKPRFLKRATS